jgi:hypothetical protein
MAEFSAEFPEENMHEKSAPGVDVMITIFCDFRQFSAKKLAFFVKNQCYDQNFCINLPLFWVKKRHFFRQKNCETI